MKKLTILIFSFLFITFFINCIRENDDGLPYYQFTSDDHTKLITPPQVGTELKYKNQDDEVITFKVLASDLGKASFITGDFYGSFSSAEFHYDRQQIKMSYNEYPQSICEINLERYPVGSNYQTSPAVVGTPKFYGYFTFPLWNKYNDTDELHNEILIDFALPIVTMTFNDKTYSKVRVFESNRTEILHLDNPPPFRPQSVHKIYYDQNNGIIGFDDLYGKSWRLE